MPTKSISQLSGISLLISAFLLLIGLILNPVDTGVTTVKEPLTIASNVLAFFAVFFTLLGLPGVFFCQAKGAGLLGLPGMLLTFFGIAILDGTHSVISFAVLPVLATSSLTTAHLAALDMAIQEGLLGSLLNIGTPIFLLGLILLGIATLRARVFPRWVGIMLIVVVLLTPLAFFVPVFSNLGLELPYFALGAAGFVLLTGRGLPRSAQVAQVPEGA